MLCVSAETCKSPRWPVFSMINDVTQSVWEEERQDIKEHIPPFERCQFGTFHVLLARCLQVNKTKKNQKPKISNTIRWKKKNDMLIFCIHLRQKGLWVSVESALQVNPPPRLVCRTVQRVSGVEWRRVGGGSGVSCQMESTGWSGRSRLPPRFFPVLG